LEKLIAPRAFLGGLARSCVARDFTRRPCRTGGVSALFDDAIVKHHETSGYLPGDLEARIDTFVDHYNHRRYHESLDNPAPADVYFGRRQTILLERERIKRATIQNRRLQHQLNAA
jgi:transposase InsO family protein